MDYIETSLSPKPFKPWDEILITALSEIDYESFVEDGDRILAYIQASKFDEGRVAKLEVFLSKDFECKVSHRTIASRNWNEEWEKNFNPIVIPGICTIRASFHPESAQGMEEIIIDPKMSFGTGHHETTRLMIRQMNELSLMGKRVLDMGTGTGVLAIFAFKKGADKITAIDNDPQAVENAQENLVLNQAERVNIFTGDACGISGMQFDLILANINRNILQRDLREYVKTLSPGGEIIMSGFFESDIKEIQDSAVKLNLQPVKFMSENSWACVRFKLNC